MAQAMEETWFVANLAALRTFDGFGFNEKPIPKRKMSRKSTEKTFCDEASGRPGTPTKKSYHKVRHGVKILALLNETGVKAQPIANDSSQRLRG